MRIGAPLLSAVAYLQINSCNLPVYQRHHGLAVAGTGNLV